MFFLALRNDCSRILTKKKGFVILAQIKLEINRNVMFFHINTSKEVEKKIIGKIEAYARSLFLSIFS